MAATFLNVNYDDLIELQRQFQPGPDRDTFTENSLFIYRAILIFTHVDLVDPAEMAQANWTEIFAIADGKPLATLKDQVLFIMLKLMSHHLRNNHRWIIRLPLTCLLSALGIG